MKLLIDTQTALWMALGDSRLKPQSQALLTANDTKRLFSAASVWEISVKWRLGKLKLPDHPSVWIDLMMKELAMDSLPMRHDHAVRAADLENHHRDPFDRILIAQAQVETIPVVTADRIFSNYDIDVIFV